MDITILLFEISEAEEIEKGAGGGGKRERAKQQQINLTQMIPKPRGNTLTAS